MPISLRFSNVVGVVVALVPSLLMGGLVGGCAVPEQPERSGEVVDSASSDALPAVQAGIDTSSEAQRPVESGTGTPADLPTASTAVDLTPHLPPGQPAALPLPSTLPLDDYERLLYPWLMQRQYASLDWAVDKGVRDTGPFIQNAYYGTHPAVRVYYSPQIVEWLEHDRQGDIPDGAMIVKEMFAPPAALYQELGSDPKYAHDQGAYEAMLGKLVTAWTVMVRDRQGSKDGWFWAGPGAPSEGQSIEAAVESQLDVFLLQMFNQFSAILGVAKTDYMTSASNGNALAMDNMVRQATNDTVDLDVAVQSVVGNVLTASVTVTNKTGHRFPSGVAFRRAFLEFLVLDGNDIVWSSGRTNGVGVIVDGNGRPLDTEFLPSPDKYQHHYQTITRQDQVQIYEELLQDAAHEFTTSFVHRVHEIKDNRLLPKGWRNADFFKDQGQVMFQFMESTDPGGDFVDGEAPPDPDYVDQGPDFPGRDTLKYVVTLPAGLDAADSSNLSVKVVMYDQSIPPYWLNQRFNLAPDGQATRRLYYLASHLDLAGTPIRDWKLELVSKQVKVP